MTVISEHRADCLYALHMFKQVMRRQPTDSYLDLALWTLMERVLSDRKIPQSNNQAWSALAEARHIQATHARDGLPTFRLTHSLAAALLLTENRTTVEDMHFPFGCFMIDLPGPESPLVLKSPYPGQPDENIQRIWVHCTEMIVDPSEAMPLSNAVAPQLDRMLEAKSVEDMGVIMRDLERVMAEALKGIRRERTLSAMLESGVGAPFLVSASIPPPGVEMETWFQALKPLGGTIERFEGADLDRHAAREADLSMVVRLVINLAAYATKHDEEGKPGLTPLARPVRSALARPPEGPAVEPRTWLLGSEIKLPHHVREMVRLAASEGEQRQPWRVSKRFIVKGHMRNQAYGPRHSLRRMQWIPPFWKGPEDVSVALIRQYMVDEDKPGV